MMNQSCVSKHQYTSNVCHDHNTSTLFINVTLMETETPLLHLLL